MDSDEIIKLGGTDIAYKYRALEYLPDASVEKYISHARTKFAKVAKSFDDDQNAEWLIRSYLSLKYLMAATVMGSTAKYCDDKNVKITRP